MKNKLLTALLSLFTVLAAQAQSSDVEMADTMRSEGKIYVVVGIILIVLVGLIVYLLLIDRKVTRLEKQLSDRQR
ncbi:CcmD family protein [Dawidia soli]|uniref:CcmD family protein n=1 Tax=Dawidia soli TaxID=2782352 RepID=A0AAP2DDU8_9BACT|nr:CcmD family protein [Dawidia soli]MBT1690213.1 CcmD family protein [Dawidia soli]